MDNNWYQQEYNQKTYLHSKALFFQPFSSENGTHDHCELCWARFSMSPDDLQGGYYEPLSKSWICADCFNELSILFGWTIDKLND